MSDKVVLEVYFSISIGLFVMHLASSEGLVCLYVYMSLIY